MTLPDPVKVSRDLAEIIELDHRLLAQAVNLASAQVDGHSLPGGLAMVSMAPVARLSKWTDQILEAERVWYESNPGAPADERPEWGVDDDDDWEPALMTLRFWSDHYRRVLAMQYDQIPTLATEAAFLKHPTVMEWVFAHEPNLDHFRDDINMARRRLENVLHAGTRTERTRIVCSDCPPRDDGSGVQLVKVYEARKPSSYACVSCSTPIGLDELDHCPNPFCWSVAPAEVLEWTSDQVNDRWKCPTCKRKYDADALRRAHAKQLLHESAARYVAWDDARATLVAQGRSVRTVRKWMEPSVEQVDRCTRCHAHWPPEEYNACPRPLMRKNLDTKQMEPTGELCGGILEQHWRGDRDAVVESYCELGTHRVMVWWPDLWRLHLSTENRRNRRTAS